MSAPKLYEARETEDGLDDADVSNLNASGKSAQRHSVN